MKQPEPNHPISIAPHDGRVRVVAGGVVIAETSRALVLEEARYPAVLYIPREDVQEERFAENARTTQCPYKGEASYLDLILDGQTRSAVAWSYKTPYPAVAAIKDHLAFYPDKVDAIEALPS